MPLYEYRCESCQHQFEVIRKFSDPPIDTCPSCGATSVVKLFSSPAFQFKGSGWYITDYARKDAKPSTDSKTDDKSDDKSDTKSDGKAESAGTSTAKDTTPSSSTGGAGSAKGES
jgi:putative FmdB family regulatory protein